MAEKQSPSLSNLLLGGISGAGSLKDIWDGNFWGYIYAGTPPATAGTAITTQTLLGTVKGPAAAKLSLAATPTNGVISKDADAWEATISNVSALAATFYRFQRYDDNNAADTGDGTRPRVQGTIGAGDFDMVVGDPALVDGSTFPVDFFTQSITPS